MKEDALLVKQRRNWKRYYFSSLVSFASNSKRDRMHSFKEELLCFYVCFCNYIFH